MSFAPPGESSADIWLEESNFVGAILGGVAYGVHIAVFAECLHHIFPRSRAAVRKIWRLLAFIWIMFAMGTANFAFNTRFMQLMYINDRNFPGGPNAYLLAHYSSAVNTIANGSYIVANFFADGLLLWRTYVVWNTVWVVIFPFLVYLASTALSILTLYQASRPSDSLWTQSTIQFSLPYFSISVALNVLLTLLIVARLFYMRARAKRVVGHEHVAVYNAVVSMIVESALPYAITGLIFIITYARNSNVQNLMLPVLSQIMCISPEVIILRVAMGRAVTPATYTPTQQTGSSARPPTAIKFRPPRHGRGGGPADTFQLTTVGQTDYTDDMDATTDYTFHSDGRKSSFGSQGGSAVEPKEDFSQAEAV